MTGSKYYSTFVSTTGANENLLDKISYLLHVENLLVYKMTLYSDTAISVSINDGGYSTLYEDANGKYSLSFDKGDIYAESVRVLEDSIDNIFVAIIYTAEDSIYEFVWVLDENNVLPQPATEQGIWIPEGVWNGSAVWYG